MGELSVLHRVRQHGVSAKALRAHLRSLATIAGYGTIFRNSDIVRFVSGGFVKTFQIATSQRTMNSRVHKGVLDLFDEYDGEFDLLHERWAPEADRQRFSSDQLQVLSQYVSELEFSRVEALSVSLRTKVQAEIARLEAFIDDDVIQILRDRILSAR